MSALKEVSTYQILFPGFPDAPSNYRAVPSETIAGWYAEAVCHGAVAEGCITHDEMATALHDAGRITLKEAA